jgi:hypothetical protein
MLEFEIIPGGPVINLILLVAKAEDIFVLHIDTGERWPQFDGTMYSDEEITLFLQSHSDKDGSSPPTRIVFKTPGRWKWGATASPRKWGLDLVLWKALPTDECESIWQREDGPIFTEDDGL